MTNPPSTSRRSPSPQDHNFGRYVRILRRARGLTQEVLAERSTLSADTIRRLEQGSFSPSLDTLRKLCSGLGVQTSTLFLGFELNLRDVPRELRDAVQLMSPEDQQRLVSLIHALRSLPIEQDD